MQWVALHQLRSKNPALRRKAARLLAHDPHPGSIPALSAALDDPDDEVRQFSAAALARLEDADRVQPLLKALRDKKPDVIKAALPGLKKAQGAEVTNALSNLLRHRDPGVRAGTARILEQLGWCPPTPELAMWLLLGKGQLTRVSHFGTLAIPALELVLESGPYNLSVGAAQALGEIQDQRVIPLLLKSLGNRDDAVCVAAIDALSKTGQPQVVPPLVKALQHPSAYVRLAAIEALAALRATHAIEPLRDLLRDSAWDVRRAAVEALGRLRDPKTTDVLAPLLADTDPDVREATAMALGRLGDRRAITPLVFSLADPTSGVRRIAAASLSRIDERWGATPEAQAAAGQLMNTLENQDSEVRYFVSQMLANLPAATSKPPASVPPEQTEEAPEEKRLKLAISLLLAILCDSDRDLRQAAAEALARIREPRSETALRRTLADPDPGVRLAAEKALRTLHAS